MNGFGRTSSIPGRNQQKTRKALVVKERTVMEIELNVITSDVGGHGDDRSSVELADQVACGHPVQIGHDDIHQDQIVFRTALHLVHGFQAVKLYMNH